MFFENVLGVEYSGIPPPRLRDIAPVHLLRHVPVEVRNCGMEHAARQQTPSVTTSLGSWVAQEEADAVKGRNDNLYQQPLFREAAGAALRPGGRELTVHALALCGFEQESSGEGKCALDVGCGAGATLALLQERGFCVTGVDPDAAMLEESRSATRGLVQLLRGHAEALPLPDASQDLVLCECVLSLCSALRQAVSECFRVLAPGGHIVLADVIRYDGCPAVRVPGLRSCLSGAPTLPRLRETLIREGFRLEYEEAHDRALTELGARLILGGESLDGLGRWLGFGCGGGPSSRDLLRSLGYVLLTARKEDA